MVRRGGAGPLVPPPDRRPAEVGRRAGPTRRPPGGCGPPLGAGESATMSHLDLVVYGATGFAGALVAGHLAAHAPEGTRIALAGRSKDRLEAVRDRLGRDWPLIVADAGDDAALAELAAATRVVVTTVGPYAKYGRALAHACAAAGTDYAD